MTLLFLLLAALPARAQTQVELQWQLCGLKPSTILQTLAVKKAKYKEKDLSYFDLEQPRYFDRGIILRRQESPKKTKLIAKARFASREDAPEDLDCEWDLHGGERTYTCKVENDSNRWSREQKELIDHQLRVDWEALVEYGPYPTEEWAWDSDFSEEPMALESMDAGLDAPFVELSVRVPAKQGDRRYEEIMDWLQESGIRLCADQEGKSSRLFRALSRR